MFGLTGLASFASSQMRREELASDKTTRCRAAPRHLVLACRKRRSNAEKNQLNFASGFVKSRKGFCPLRRASRNSRRTPQSALGGHDDLLQFIVGTAWPQEHVGSRVDWNGGDLHSKSIAPMAAVATKGNARDQNGPDLNDLDQPGARLRQNILRRVRVDVVTVCSWAALIAAALIIFWLTRGTQYHPLARAILLASTCLLVLLSIFELAWAGLNAVFFPAQSETADRAGR